MNELGLLQVSEAIDIVNQSLSLSVPMLWVEGEVSGFKISKQRWVFFDLQDEKSSLRCFMSVHKLGFSIEDGMKVKVSARPNLHNKYGFSLVVERLQPSGEGDLKKAFELSKKKLSAEGLFDIQRKRTINEFPSRIGLITSQDAAAFTDVLRILEDSWPIAEVLFAHADVQGADAPKSLIAALGALNALPNAPDTIIMTRGGGSLEDLSAFNDENLVRAIVASKVPVIVGVGHQRDETLAGLAADIRATTPTNAAQLVSVDKHTILARIDDIPKQLIMVVEHSIEIHEQNISTSLNRLSDIFERRMNDLENYETRLKAGDPKRILKRGFAIVRSDKGQLVRSASQLGAGDIIKTKFSDGEVSSKVK